MFYDWERHLDKDEILKIKLINLHLNQNIVDDFTIITFFFPILLTFPIMLSLL